MDATSNSERPIQFTVDVSTLRKSEAPTRERWIRMLASTPDLDKEGERVHPEGMNLAYHLAAGFFTDEHDIRVRSPDGKLIDVIPAAKIGEPRALPGEKSALTMTERGPVITGVLFVGPLDHQNRPGCRCDGCRADYWWFLLETLERSGAHRRVQASVDGKVLRRTVDAQGNADVWECMVADVALTLTPMNAGTWVELVKSMRAWLTDGSSTRKSARNANSIHAYEDAPGVISESGAIRYLVEQKRLAPELARWAAQKAFARRAA